MTKSCLAVVTNNNIALTAFKYQTEILKRWVQFSGFTEAMCFCLKYVKLIAGSNKSY